MQEVAGGCYWHPQFMVVVCDHDCVGLWCVRCHSRAPRVPACLDAVRGAVDRWSRGIAGPLIALGVALVHRRGSCGLQRACVGLIWCRACAQHPGFWPWLTRGTAGTPSCGGWYGARLRPLSVVRVHQFDVARFCTMPGVLAPAGRVVGGAAGTPSSSLWWWHIAVANVAVRGVHEWWHACVASSSPPWTRCWGFWPRLRGWGA